MLIFKFKFLPMIIKTPIHLCQGKTFFKNILESIQAKMRLDPERIWYEEAVVKISAIKIRHRLPWWKMAAGKNMKGLNSNSSLDWVLVSLTLVLFSVVVSFWSFFVPWPFQRFQTRVMKMQANSPTDRPQVCKNGCRKMWLFPFFPSEYSVFEYLKKENVNKAYLLHKSCLWR